MKVRVISTLLVFIVVCASIKAYGFETLLLHDMTKALNLNSKGLPADTVIKFNSPKAKKTVIIRTDNQGSIEHLGYEIFDREICNEDKGVIYDFLERYLLLLDLNVNGFSAPKRLEIDGVKLIGGDPQLLKTLTKDTPLTVSNYNWKSIEFEWTLPQGSFIMQVPADRELIFGASSPELEEIFITKLKKTKVSAQPPIIESLKKWGYDLPEKTLIDNDVVKIEGKPYLSDLIRNDITLFSSIDGEKIYINSKSPSQSVANIMLTGYTDTLMPFELTIDKYGHKKEYINTFLSALLQVFREEGCQIFFGIKRIDDEKVEGTLFAVNKELAYNHVVSVVFPLAALDGNASIIKGVVYAYVPLQNVYEDFFYKDISIPEFK